MNQQESNKLALVENEVKHITASVARIEKTLNLHISDQEIKYAGKWTESWVKAVGFTTFGGLLVAIFGVIIKILSQ